MHVFCDFDGTIAQCDVTDLALQAFAAPEWEDLERAWLAGQMDAAACMRGQIALMEAPSALLDALLDSVEIDPGFADFVAWCEARAIPVTVVSDGVDYFIQRVLRRHGLARLPVYSNQLVRHDDGALSLRQPWRSPACSAGSGVCKCAVARAIKEPMVFVGDGRSDQCVSHRAEQLFAKDKLAEYCRKNGLPFLSYATFDDVRAALADVRAARELGAGDAGENLTITE